MRPLIALLIALLSAETPAFSEGREAIGNGRLFTNDFFWRWTGPVAHGVYTSIAM